MKNCNSEKKQILIYPKNGRGTALIETVTDQMFADLTAIGENSDTLSTYIDTEGNVHKNVKIVSLGLARERE